MNERIYELYIQVVGDDKLNFDSYLAEKFAELIIRQCAQVAIDHDPFWGASVDQDIKQHFGVKE